MMNHRHAMLRRFNRPGRTGRTIARVGATDEKDLRLDPAKYRTYYRQIYDKSKDLWGLGFVIFSLGQRLAELREVAAEVESVGGGSLQLRLELERRKEDYFELVQRFSKLVQGDVDDVQESFAELERFIFVSFPQNEGEWEYMDGGTQLPPRYGMAWEIGTLTNQVWAMWHPANWILDDPDTPWWEWIPVAIAAGWVDAINSVQETVSDAPESGPGWGAEIGQAAEDTSQVVSELAEEGAEALGKIGASATGALVAAGALFLGAAFFLGGRR